MRHQFYLEDQETVVIQTWIFGRGFSKKERSVFVILRKKLMVSIVHDKFEPSSKN
jgi:hypothetical protein